MPPVTIYTTSWCPYCQSAKALLSKKGVAFEEIDVEAKPDQRQAMIARSTLALSQTGQVTSPRRAWSSKLAEVENQLSNSWALSQMRA